jgi:hypothetical protein
MTGISSGPAKVPILMGERNTVKEEVKYRTHPLGGWKSYLFWVIIIIAFMVFLCLLDLLA